MTHLHTVAIQSRGAKSVVLSPQEERDALPEPTSLMQADPWVADLSSESRSGECQSTIGFDNQPCVGDSAHYVELEIRGYPVANPRWEGKLCPACLTGWQEWAVEEPDAIRIVSIHPIVWGD